MCSYVCLYIDIPTLVGKNSSRLHNPDYPINVK